MNCPEKKKRKKNEKGIMKETFAEVGCSGSDAIDLDFTE